MADLPTLPFAVPKGASLADIARMYGVSNLFGGADYIAAKAVGHSDQEILDFLAANPYMNPQGNITAAIKSGQTDQLIANATPNLAASDIKRAAYVDPNAASSAAPAPAPSGALPSTSTALATPSYLTKMPDTVTSASLYHPGETGTFGISGTGFDNIWGITNNPSGQGQITATYRGMPGTVSYNSNGSANFLANTPVFDDNGDRVPGKTQQVLYKNIVQDSSSDAWDPISYSIQGPANGPKDQDGNPLSIQVHPVQWDNPKAPSNLFTTDVSSSGKGIAHVYISGDMAKDPSGNLTLTGSVTPFQSQQDLNQRVFWQGGSAGGNALMNAVMAIAPAALGAYFATPAFADTALGGALGSANQYINNLVGLPATATPVTSAALNTIGGLASGKPIGDVLASDVGGLAGQTIGANIDTGNPALNKQISNIAGNVVTSGLTGAPINPQQIAGSVASNLMQGALPSLTGPTGQTLGIVADNGTTPSATAALPADQVGALSNLQDNSGDIGTSYDLTPPAPPVHEDSPMGSMANIGIPYQGQGAISGADALDPTTAYYNSFDLTNPSAEASAGTTTSYGGGLGQSAYNVPTTPVSQQQPGVPTDYTSVPVSSGYALTPDLTGPGITPSDATSGGKPVQSAAPASGGTTAQNYFNSVINQAAQNTSNDKTGRTMLTPTMFTGQAPSQQQSILSPLAQLQLALSGYQPALTKAVRQRMASGGQPYHPEAKPGEPIFRTGGHTHYVQGKGDGQSDDIPAMLADGEYVFDADTVSQLGDGSNKAGAEKLDKFREALRRHKRSAPDDKIPPKAKKLTSYLKEAERG